MGGWWRPGGGGMHKHRTSGRSGKSPALRHAMRREAECNEIKDKSRIKDSKESVREVFHGARKR